MSSDHPDHCYPMLGPISKDSRLEWRSYLRNDNEIVDGTVPDNFLTAELYKGKFFPRGCRGKIERFEIYCRRTAAGTLTLWFSPEPSMGPVDGVLITPGATWAWQSTNYRRFWNYDSMFIWVQACSADVSYAYDTVQPYDAHSGEITLANWQRQTRRYNIRVVYDAETPGDVPVSGTINNIEIPSVSTARKSMSLNVPPLSELLDTIQCGAGKTLIIIFDTGTDLARDNLMPRIYCDGQSVLPIDATFANWRRYIITKCTQDIKIGVWDTVLPSYVIIVTLHLPFKRSLQIGYYNTDNAVVRMGAVSYTFVRIS